MSKDKDTKQEILPPRHDPQRGRAVSVIGESPPESAKGVVDAVITGFVADVQQSTIRKIERRTRAQTALVQAQTELYNSGGNLKRSLAALHDIDATLDNDQAERDAEREKARHLRDEADKDRQHQEELTSTRRMTEQVEEDIKFLKAQNELAKLDKTRGLDQKRAFDEAYVERAKAAMAAAEHRAGRKADALSAEIVNSPMLALEQQLNELKRQLQDATADNREDEQKRLDEEIAAVEITIAIMKKASG